MKVVLVIGTRPQYIKLAPFIRAAKGKLELVTIDTGQHYDAEMSRGFIREFRLKAPDYHLNVGSASHGLQTGRMLGKLDAVISAEMPDMTVVFGDTNSTLAGALAAAKLGIPVTHIEAGTRSNDLNMPEEINRRMVDAVSSLLFAPTANTALNLKREGHGDEIHQVGDIMVDSLAISLRMAECESKCMSTHKLEKGKYIYATVHRPSNTDDKPRLKTLLSVMNGLDMPVILPAHPRTLKRIREFALMNETLGNVTIMPPISHYDSISLIKNAHCVMTDSGGVAKEAYLLETPCVTLRDSTEWPETVESGYNILADADPTRILWAVEYGRSWLGAHKDYFGTAGVSERIIRVIAGAGQA